MAVSDYKTDPNENTTISGINIAEGCQPSGINNAIRQLMADVKAANDAVVKTVNGNAPDSDGNATVDVGVKTVNDNAPDSDGNATVDVGVKKVNGNAPDSNGNITPAQTGCLPLTGGTMTGNIVVDNETNYINIGYIYGDSSGSLLSIRSKNYSLNPGGFELFARNSSGGTALIGKADGGLTWYSKKVVHTGFKLGEPVWIGTLNVGSTYTAPSLGIFTGGYAAGNAAVGSLAVNGGDRINFTNPDSGYGTIRMPVTLVVGAGNVVSLKYGGKIVDTRFIPLSL